MDAEIQSMIDKVIEFANTGVTTNEFYEYVKKLWLEHMKKWYKELLKGLDEFIPDELKDQPSIIHDDEDKKFHETVDKIDAILLS